jgi:lysophospholipase L1-like esterase
MSGPSRFLLRQLGDLVLGVLVTVVIFLIAELTLRLAGYGEPSGSMATPRHLAAGFDSSAEVFEPDPDHPGGWRSRYSHDRSKELVIPPKGTARRVLLFGGSNTAGFPRRVLQDALNARGEGEFEVLNLGRAGYGSTRVAILFREALERLEPDVVVMYTGHNEFVEKSFAMDVEDAWGNAVVAGLARGLEATVTGRTLTKLLEEDQVSSQYSQLSAWEAEYKKFTDLPWQDTLKVWGAYEENLRYMASLAAEHEVPMLLCTVVWNRLSGPRLDTPSQDVPQESVDRARNLHKRVRRLYPEPLTALLPLKDKQRVHLFDWGGTRQLLEEGQLQDPLPGLRPSTGWLADEDPAFKIERIWMPRVRAWYEALAWLNAPRTPEEAEALDSAGRLLEKALELLPESAHFRYELALVQYAAGKRDEALRADFEEAARIDRAPRKGNPHSNERVRKVATECPGVELFDADLRFVEGCPGGLVGWEWMVDHCHLSPGARAALLRDMADEVAGLAQGGR